MKLKRFEYAVATALVMLLAGCGGGGGGGGGGGSTPPATGTTPPGGTTPSTQYTLGGTVYGLAAGTPVTISNGSEKKIIPANGKFTLDTKLNAGASYNVEAVPPAGYTCQVGNGSGTINANLDTVTVACAPVVGNQVAGQVAGLSTALKEPLAVTSDGNGNLYVADAGPHTIFKVDAAGKVSAFAGTTGKPGKADGAAGSAQFWLGGAGGLALDGQGNLFVSDGCNGEIRKVSPDGSVSTLAGTSSAACNNVKTAAAAPVDGAPGVANFDRPGSLVSDGAGGVIVIDTSGSAPAVRMVSAAGVTTTKTYAKPVTGEFILQRIARAQNGTLYFSDTNNRIWRDTGTTLALVAGRLEGVGSADGTGINARFNPITGMVVLPNGDLYVAERASVRKVTPAGVVTTLAGNDANRGYANGTGTAAVFGTLLSITYDGKSLVVVDSGQEILRKIDPATGVVTTVSGTPALRESVDGPGIAARFGSFSSLAAGADGNLYMVDPATNLVRMATTAGVVTTVGGKAGKGTADGPLATATFDTPNRIAAGKDGSLWIAQSQGVRRILNGTVSTPDKGLKGVNLAIDPRNGDAIVVTGTNSGEVVRVTAAGVSTTILTAAQVATQFPTTTTARFTPQSVAVDAAGNIYIADTGTVAVYKLAADGQLSLFAGTPYSEGNLDGAPNVAKLGFYEIDHMTIDGENLYLSGQGSVRKIDKNGFVSSPSFGWGNADIGAVTVLGGKLYGMTRYALLQSSL